MPQLPLPHGLFALVDDDVFEWARHSHWVLKGGDQSGNYVGRSARNGRGARTTEYLHRLVCPVPEGMQVDHINRDRLDCRRSNLRPATQGQNNQNKRPTSSLTGVKGVYMTTYGAFRAMAWLDGVTFNLGTYRSIAEAASVVDEFRRRHYTHASEPIETRRSPS